MGTNVNVEEFSKDAIINKIKEQLSCYYNKLNDNAGLEHYIKFDEPRNDYELYIFIDEENKNIHLRTKERGNIIKDDAYTNVEEVCYLIMDSIVYKIATRYELTNRVKYQDSRRVVYAKQIELMGMISENFKIRKENEINNLLVISAYNDVVHCQLDLIDDYYNICCFIRDNKEVLKRVSLKGRKIILEVIDDVQKVRQQGVFNLFEVTYKDTLIMERLNNEIRVGNANKDLIRRLKKNIKKIIKIFYECHKSDERRFGDGLKVNLEKTIKNI